MARPSSTEAAKRMLALISLLEDEARVPLSDIASALGVSESVAAREVERLSCCGIDGYLMMPVYVDGDEVEVFNDLPGLTQPIRLSGNESRALVAALSSAGVDDDDPLLLKLLAATAVDPPTADEVSAVLHLEETEPAVAENLKALSLAIERGHIVRLVHRNSSTGEEIDRTVEPWSLLRWDGNYYLQGFCRRAGGFRNFRVDRIVELTVLEERVVERDVTPATIALDTAGMPLARIRLSEGLTVHDLRWPEVRTVDEADGGTVVEVPFGGPAWIARQVLSLQGRAEVLDPPELREAVRALARSERAAAR